MNKNVKNRETRQDVFLRNHPRISYEDENGVLKFCPSMIDSLYHCEQYFIGKEYISCDACRHRYWTKEVSENGRIY